MTDSELSKKYKKLSPIEHVLLKPGMYIGDIDFRSDRQFIFKNNKIVLETISWSPGLYKIFDEIIVNAYDQNIRDNTLSKIYVEIQDDNFICYNNGVGIDVEKHPEHKIYIPELIFANLMTSTNYDESEERITGGTHGLGSKLTAIFSKKFIIEVWDKKRKLYYKQVIEDNLSKINKPEIEKITSNDGGVKITVYPDFEKFGKTDKFNEMKSLLEKRVIDLVGLVSLSVEIKLNNEVIDKSSWENYLNFYQSDWIIGNCSKSNRAWEFAIRFNNNNYETDTHISFVNGIYTSRGGKHLEYFIDVLFPKLQKMVSPELTRKLVKDYLNIALKTSIVNPSFSSQTKEELMTPPTKFGIECEINNKFWDLVKETDIINNLKQVVSLSSQKILSKLEGSKKSKIKGVSKLEDANYAGTKRSMECTLILTEGDSAKATAISGISAVKDGRNYFGVFPLRGKLLNVREASTSQIANNQEITEVKKILGLKTGVKRDELRYGSVLLMMDADEDGSHIKGLFINFLDYFYPHLIEEKGFLKILVTPVVKATLKDQVLSFANLRTYTTWKDSNDTSKWSIKYYKGLGTSTAKEAQEYFTNLTKNTIDILDTQKQGANPDILLAFGKEKVNQRKDWLINYDAKNILQLEPPTTITIKQFIHQELIHFSNYDNIRSIPSIIDGFKPSQRKVIYACLKRNLINEMKVAQLAGAVAEITAYHHGEQSLVSTIINLAQNFVGANNINLLEPVGQFGTRLMGGKDHSSARYIFTKLTEHIFKIIKKEDNNILEYLDDDGTPIEPKFFLPIVPLCLINGAEGIGTGFSTSIPNYDIKDIVEYIIGKLKGEDKKVKLIPYYNNFKGRIFKYDDNTFVSEGVLTYDGKNIEITELPIKFWTSDYKEFLEELIESKESLFRNYQNLSSDTEVKFIIKVDPDKLETVKKLLENVDENGLNQLYKMLKLYKTIKVSNLTLYDTKGSLKTYSNVNQIINEFYDFRLEWYEKRRLSLINQLEKDLEIVINQIKFLELVINDKGKIFNKEEDELIKYLKDNGLKQKDNSYDYLLNIPFRKINKSNLDKYINESNKIKKEIKELKNKTNKDLWINDMEILI
jgi:DNA topoisomerase-2